MPESLPTVPQPFRAGVVSFLNARPLIHGLDRDPHVRLVRAVPARLAGLVESGIVDVALVPVIDTMQPTGCRPIVSDACIASDGATLTVRVFSRVDPADITALHVDRDSHTSVALASIIWREKYGRRLDLLPFPLGPGAPAAELSRCQAVLLIGDKVIRPPIGLDAFSTQVDLGATWRSMTGLPFVFAVWATAGGVGRTAADTIATTLAAARDAGVARAGEIAATVGPAMGWPADLARRYLTEFLSYRLGRREREGLRLFLELARVHNVVATSEQPVFT